MTMAQDSRHVNPQFSGGGPAPGKVRTIPSASSGWTTVVAAASRPPWWPSLPRPEGRDVVAGFSVALVLVPQSLAYAVLAGMPPAVGLTVGAVATIAAAPFVSSPYLQTGPVAITALLTFGGLAGLAEPASAPYLALAALLALMVGVLRLVIAVARAGSLAYLMSQPVLAGFTPAAALVIAISQLPEMLGMPAVGRGPVRIVPALLDVTAWDVTAMGFAALTVAVMLGARRVHRLFPAVLAAVVVGLVVARAVGFDGAVVGRIPGELPRLQFALPWSRLPDLLVPAVVIALVGFAEPAAIARTYAQETRSRWDADREFVSQGVANVASGVFGGFPVGGSFSRSAISRQAGARTGWSGAFTGLLVLLSLPVVGVFEGLPAAVLAAVIFASVLGLVRLAELRRLRRWSRQQFFIATTTFVLTLVLAPQIQIAIIVGVLLSVVAHLRRELELTAPHWVDRDALHLRPLGVLYFGSAHRLEDQVTDLLSDHPDVTRLVIHMDRLGRVDVTGALALRSLVEGLHGIGVATVVADLTPTSHKIVDRVLSDAEHDVELRAVEPRTRGGSP